MIASKILAHLYKRGAMALELFRKNATSPNDTKILKKWGISDVANMVNRTTQTIRNLEEAGKLPTPEKIQNGKRIERVYTLKHINIIRDFFNVRPSKPKDSKPVIVGISNFKGGVGKTINSLTLAQGLALKGYRILLIDSDNQGSSTHLGGGYIPDLHITPDQTLLHVLTGRDSNIRQTIQKTHWDGLDIIPANLSLYNAEMLVPQQIYQHKETSGEMLPFYSRLKNALALVEDDYDIIIMDTPPSLGVITLNVLFAINGLIIPLLPSEVDFCSTVQFLNMTQEAFSRLPPVEYHFIKFLLSKYKLTTQSKTMEAAARQVWGSEVMTNCMFETEAVAKASADMKTIFEVEPHQNDKRTFNRAIEHANSIITEVESLIKMAWTTEQISSSSLNELKTAVI